MDSLNFLAFDTETATNNPASMCQIGFVLVQNGQTTLEKSFLIQPPGNDYSARHSCIHGIDALSTRNKPTFPAIWHEIKTYFVNQLLVAHNANFDLRVLNSTLDFYNIPKPVFKCDCTFEMSGLSLKCLSDSLTINMVQHHDALSDARTCAKAYLCLKHGKKPDPNLIKVTRPKEIGRAHV